MRRVLLTIGLIAVICVVSLLSIIYGGMYDIAATSKHNAVTLWAINTLTDNSIRSNAADINVPPNLDDSAKVADGFEHYDEMCVTCHGAPGIGPDEFAAGLYPKAPSLIEPVEEWNDAELFWITKHGIKMTGMPAIGDVHSDTDIWNIVAFLKKMPELGYYGYLDLRKAAESAGHSHEHSDEDGD